MSQPIELLRLRTACTVFLDELAAADLYAEQAADVNRSIFPAYAELLDRLRDEIRAARNVREMGTVATLERVVQQMLGQLR